MDLIRLRGSAPSSHQQQQHNRNILSFEGFSEPQMRPSPRGVYLSEESDDDGPPGLEDCVAEQISPTILQSSKQPQSSEKPTLPVLPTVSVVFDFDAPEKRSFKPIPSQDSPELGSQTLRTPRQLTQSGSNGMARSSVGNSQNLKRGSMRQPVLRRRADVAFSGEERGPYSAREKSLDRFPQNIALGLLAGSGSSQLIQGSNNDQTAVGSLAQPVVSLSIPSIRIGSINKNQSEDSGTEMYQQQTSGGEEQLKTKRLRVLEEEEEQEEEHALKLEGGKQPTDQAIFKYIEKINESIRLANEKIDGLPRLQKTRKVIAQQIEELAQIFGSETETKQQSQQQQSPRTARRRSKGNYLPDLIASKKESLKYLKESESLIEDLNRQSKICSKMGRTLLDFHSIIQVELSNLRSSTSSASAKSSSVPADFAEQLEKQSQQYDAMVIMKNAEVNAEKERVQMLLQELQQEVERRKQVEDDLDNRMVHFQKLYEDAQEAKMIIAQEMKYIAQQKEALQMRSEQIWQKENMLGIRPQFKSTTAQNSVSPFREIKTETPKSASNRFFQMQSQSKKGPRVGSPSEIVDDDAQNNSQRKVPQATSISDGATKFASTTTSSVSAAAIAASRIRGDSFGIQQPFASASDNNTTTSQSQYYSKQQQSVPLNFTGTSPTAGTIANKITTPSKQQPFSVQSQWQPQQQQQQVQQQHQKKDSSSHMSELKKMIQLIQCEKQSLLSQLNPNTSSFSTNSYQ